MTETPIPPHVTKDGGTFFRRFVELRKKSDLPHNLTELSAADQQDGDGDGLGFYNHPDFFAHVMRYAYMVKLFNVDLSPLQEGAKLLDVGCGRMQLAKYMWRNRAAWSKGFEFWGIDLRAQANWLDPLKVKTNLGLVRGDIVQDDFSVIPAWPGTFDFVVSFESFEHVPVAHQQEFMNRLFNWTAPGGLCLFATPNAGVARSTAENHVVDGENRERTYDDKLAMAQAAGFEHLKSYGTFCGATRLPPEMQKRIKEDPFFIAAKEFLNYNQFVVFIAAAFPRESNDALMIFKRPS